MKGIPVKNKTSKIYSEGRTYDNKLYTFQENDHRNMWSQLDVVVKKLTDKNNWRNLPSERLAQQSYQIEGQAILNSRGGKVLDSNGFEMNAAELLQ